jgi:hypothetical protein
MPMTSSDSMAISSTEDPKMDVNFKINMPMEFPIVERQSTSMASKPLLSEEMPGSQWRCANDGNQDGCPGLGRLPRLERWSPTGPRSLMTAPEVVVFLIDCWQDR